MAVQSSVQRKVSNVDNSIDRMICERMPQLNNEQGRAFIKVCLGRDRNVWKKACLKHGWAVPSVIHTNGKYAIGIILHLEVQVMVC